MKNLCKATALTAVWLALSIASPLEVEALPQQGGQQEAALSQRVTELETALALLRGEYDARLAAIEAQIAELRAAGLSTAPDLTAAANEAAAEFVEETMTAEERAELERELAELLGEAGAEAPAGAGELEPTQGGERRFQSQTRNLNDLNPEISVTGDVSAIFADRTGDPDVNRFRFNEFEASFIAPLDPYSAAKFFIVQEGGKFKLEEGYIDYNTLPAGLGVKAGQMRLDWGKLNRWHQHSLPQADRPAAHLAIWGEEGLTGLGASLSWIPPPFLGDYNEIIVQVANDENDVSFSGRGFDQPVFLIHETNYFDISEASYVEVGFSATGGTNDLAVPRVRAARRVPLATPRNRARHLQFVGYLHIRLVQAQPALVRGRARRLHAASRGTGREPVGRVTVFRMVAERMGPFPIPVQLRFSATPGCGARPQVLLAVDLGHRSAQA